MEGTEDVERHIKAELSDGEGIDAAGAAGSSEVPQPEDGKKGLLHLFQTVIA